LGGWKGGKRGVDFDLRGGASMCTPHFGEAKGEKSHSFQAKGGEKMKKGKKEVGGISFSLNQAGEGGGGSSRGNSGNTKGKKGGGGTDLH